MRLKGGCPSVFSRCGSELRALAAAGCAAELVPGVSSALAAPLFAGMPLATRASTWDTHHAQSTLQCWLGQAHHLHERTRSMLYTHTIRCGLQPMLSAKDAACSPAPELLSADQASLADADCKYCRVLQASP